MYFYHCHEDTVLSCILDYLNLHLRFRFKPFHCEDLYTTRDEEEKAPLEFKTIHSCLLK